MAEGEEKGEPRIRKDPGRVQGSARRNHKKQKRRNTSKKENRRALAGEGRDRWGGQRTWVKRRI